MWSLMKSRFTFHLTSIRPPLPVAVMPVESDNRTCVLPSAVSAVMRLPSMRMARAQARLHTVTWPGPLTPLPGISSTALSVIRVPLPIMYRRQAMPPISRPGCTDGRPLLERFISSGCFSRSGPDVIASGRPAATLRASVSPTTAWACYIGRGRSFDLFASTRSRGLYWRAICPSIGLRPMP